MHLKVFDILAMPTPETEEGMELWNKCYSFVSSFCRHNPTNQAEVYSSRMLTLLKHLNCEPVTANVAEALIAMMTDNELILKEVDDRLYFQIFKVLGRVQNARLLQLLETSISFKGERHTKNSTMLMKRLASSINLLEFWAQPNGRDSLVNAMLDWTEGHKEPLEWHLAGISLLAQCCKGKAPGLVLLKRNNESGTRS